MKPKIIICDTNQELIDAIKKANIVSDYVDIEVVCGDIIELHEKTPNSRIVTASNPEFSPDGGLDAALAKKYTWSNPREFELTKDLFFVKSVDSSRKATETILFRALVGLFLHRQHGTFLLPVLGCGIGGFAVAAFILLLSRVLRYANLRYANLSYADLRSADLSYADLRSANLSSADLSYADLRSADLSYADLSYANLSYANLSSADLSYANLSYADLRSADLRSANLSSANLRYAKNILKVIYNEVTAFFALCCPEIGVFTAWKKAANGLIIQLEIPAKAKRSSATTRKCRASEAKVIAIFNGKKKVKIAISSHDPKFIYKVGEIVKPTEPFDKDRWNECSSGIHFFITRKEAENWDS